MEAAKKVPQQVAKTKKKFWWPLSSGGGGKVLVAWPLVEELYFAASLTTIEVLWNFCKKNLSWSRIKSRKSLKRIPLSNIHNLHLSPNNGPFYPLSSGCPSYPWYLHKMVGQGAVPTPGVNRIIRSVKGSCLYRQQLQILNIFEKVLICLERAQCILS